MILTNILCNKSVTIHHNTKNWCACFTECVHSVLTSYELHYYTTRLWTELKPKNASTSKTYYEHDSKCWIRKKIKPFSICRPMDVYTYYSLWRAWSHSVWNQCRKLCCWHLENNKRRMRHLVIHLYAVSELYSLEKQSNCSPLFLCYFTYSNESYVCNH